MSALGPEAAVNRLVERTSGCRKPKAVRQRLEWAHLSVATAVGFIALAGLASEFGVVMLVYLDQAIEHRVEIGSSRRMKTWTTRSSKAQSYAYARSR